LLPQLEALSIIGRNDDRILSFIGFKEGGGLLFTLRLEQRKTVKLQFM